MIFRYILNISVFVLGVIVTEREKKIFKRKAFPAGIHRVIDKVIKLVTYFNVHLLYNAW